MGLKQLSVGKIRGFASTTNLAGSFSILAFDHRQSFIKLLNPWGSALNDYPTIAAAKSQFVRLLAPHASAVLLDPVFGAAQAIVSDALPGETGLIVSLEETGYTGTDTARETTFLSNWSIQKTKRMGADAVKLLVYYHPESPTAGEIEALVRQVAADCQAQDLPLFLEPLSYSLDPAIKKLAPEELHRVVVETARRLTQYPIDVLKAEFPLDIKAEPDEKRWMEACAELSTASRVPWVLLSASVDYDVFLRQVTVACQQGASGVAVGRAVWKEATKLSGEGRLEFLSTTAKNRMERLTALCAALAKPWTDFYVPPQLATDWYVEY